MFWFWYLCAIFSALRGLALMHEHGVASLEASVAITNMLACWALARTYDKDSK